MNATKPPFTFSALIIAGSFVVAAPPGFTGCSNGHQDHTGHSHGSAAAKPYPLSKCLVTDEGFDHGKPYTFVHEGQEIKLCCKDCLADFNKEPAKYLTKLNTPN